MSEIIGRKKEIADLEYHYNSGRAELIAVYGRRGVGKTFLINEVFGDSMTFHHTALSPYNTMRKVTKKDQLQNFYFSLLKYGTEGISVPKSWMEAFFFLEKLLRKVDNGTRQVVFIDEMPWLDTTRSGFLTAFEGFWNGWGNTRHNLCLVTCGSATSWMLNNLINDKGGLYGRVTGKMKLLPFTLNECEAFFMDRKVKMSRYNIIQSYMIMGGIPYYMNYFNPRYSLAQNIDELFFQKEAKLGDEFELLFNTAFDNAGDCMKVIRKLYERRYGFTRDEIAKSTGINPNGDFSKVLKALSESDFIERYVPFGYGKHDEHYKLTDCFCWFWLHFKEDRNVTEHELNTWRGIAFENVCMRHVSQIKGALGVYAVASKESPYIIHGNENTGGSQVDLLIDRDDDIVNVCEMKYLRAHGRMTSEYQETIQSRMEYLEQKFPDKTIHMTLVSTNPYDNASDVFQSVIASEDLFGNYTPRTCKR